jgi:peptidoglycan/xylan/chitin deacetylase (PgdA/CDA1 family)
VPDRTGLSVRRPAKRWNLLIHGVGAPLRKLEPGESELWIQPGQLHAILDLVATREVKLSVDDGNRSDVDHVLPALVERALHATFFVIAARLDQPGSLSRAAVCELRDAGMEIGTHGMNHVPWRSLDAVQERREFVDARHAIEDVVQRPVDIAACPLGRYDRGTLSSLRHYGYRQVYTSDGWPGRPDVWLQPRYSIRATDDPDQVRARLDRAPGVRQRTEAFAKGLVKRLR